LLGNFAQNYKGIDCSVRSRPLKHTLETEKHAHCIFFTSLATLSDSQLCDRQQPTTERKKELKVLPVT